jgi:hypothetical protein
MRYWRLVNSCKYSLPLALHLSGTHPFALVYIRKLFLHSLSHI